MNLPGDFLTFSDLGTLAGLAISVYILVSAAQWAGLVFPVKTVAVVLAIVLSVLVAVLSGHYDAQSILMSVINGALAALVSTGFSAAVDEVHERQMRRVEEPLEGLDYHAQPPSRGIAGAPQDVVEQDNQRYWYYRW